MIATLFFLTACTCFTFGWLCCALFLAEPRREANASSRLERNEVPHAE